MTDMPGGQVTLADLFRVLTAIQTNLATMSAKLEVIDSRNATADKDVADHETRLRALERFRWSLAGISTAAGLASGYVGYLIGHVH